MLFGRDNEGKKLDRLLSEFPWLWAISSKWIAGKSLVEIKEATSSLLSEPLGVEENRNVWVVSTDFSHNSVCVGKGCQLEGESLAVIAMANVASGYINYIATKKTMGWDSFLVTILRLRKGARPAALHKMCSRLENKEVNSR